MPELREVLTCPRVDEVPIPSTQSFNCECEQCGARVWVATAVLSNLSACARLAAQRTTTKSKNRTEQTDFRWSSNNDVVFALTYVRYWHKADIRVVPIYVRF